MRRPMRSAPHVAERCRNVRASRRRHALVPLAAAILASGCGGRPEAPVRGTADTAAELEAALVAFFAAYEAGQADSVVSFFTRDARLMPPGAPTVRGTVGLVQNVRAGVALGRWVQSAPADTLVALGDHAVQVGRYAIRFEPTAATPDGMSAFEDRGRYMIHWTRGADGRWRMAHYIANREG